MTDINPEEILSKCQSKLISFARVIYPNFKDPWHLRKLAHILEKVERGELDRVMIQFPPRHGKPLVSNMVSLLMQDGSYKLLQDIAVGDKVITHTGKSCKVSKVFKQGLLPACKITTTLGQEIATALDHPFLTTEGWKQAKDLTTKDMLAIPSNIQCKATAQEQLAEFIMAGYFVGDGAVGLYGKSQNTGFTNQDEQIVQDFIHQAQVLGWAVVAEKRKYHYRVRNGTRNIRHWLQEKDVSGTSYTKHVPEWVFRGTNEQIAAYIGAYFNCDGHINKRSSVREDCCLEFYSVSKQLLIDTQNLLIRLGIKSRLRIKKGLYKRKRHLSWRLAITSQHEAVKAKKILRLVGDKATQISNWPVIAQEFYSPFLTAPIESIEAIGLQDCRCLEVENDHTFLANNIVVHNSVLTSQLFPAWFAGRNPDKKIILATGTQSLSQEFGYYCRSFLMDPNYKLIFPNANIRQDSKAITQFRFGRTGVANFVSRGTQITGKGADLFVMDDLTIDAQDAASEKEQKTLRMWYKSVAYNRLQKGGRIIIIGTRWREDDIQGWLLNPEEQERIDNWTIFRFPAIADEDEEFRKQGEPLWPEEFNVEALERIQQEDRRSFAGLYQQRPSIEQGNIVQRHWLQLEKITDEMLKGPRIMALDTAFKEGEQNDYSAAVIGQMCGANIGVLYAEQKKLDFPKLIAWIKAMVKIYGIQAILCEDAASGQSVIQTIRKELPDCPIIPIKIKRGEDKESLMHAICPFLETGRVIINKFAGVDTLLDNLLMFPQGAHDDLADSFRILISYMIHHNASLRKLGHKRTMNVPVIYGR